MEEKMMLSKALCERLLRLWIEADRLDAYSDEYVAIYDEVLLLRKFILENKIPISADIEQRF